MRSLLDDIDYLNVPAYLRCSKLTPPTNIHKTINLDEATDSNLQAISVMNQLNAMKSGQVLKVEGELTDTCTMNIREFSGAEVLRQDGVAYVTCADHKKFDNESYLDIPAVVRSGSVQ